MRYFPIFVDTHAQDALVVGAGEVAARKIELLLRTSAKVTVVAPRVCQTVQQFAQQGQITLIQRQFQDGDIANQVLVFCATDVPAVNQHVYRIASAAKLLVNVVDNPPLCRFITPAIVDRSPIVVALASGGKAPVLLRYLRQKLEAVIPQSVSRLGKLFQQFRDPVKAKLQQPEQRRSFWEDVMEGDIAELVYNDQAAAAAAMLQQQLDSLAAPSAADPQQATGTVYLIGAGPGDPELLTFKALRLMQKADVVVYDRLVSQGTLDMVRRDAEKIYVGKAKSKHTLPQESISQLLVQRAKRGERVVRLKGGDPFVFGRGGEEIETLIAQQIPFQVIPGITAATGAASYAGIPLTHRDHAQAVIFATGHLRDDSINLNWPALAQKNQTLVFYMGLTGLGIICRQLLRHGSDLDTPVAIVEQATTANQRVIVGNLQTIQQIAADAAISPPSLIIVGTVISLYESFKPYNSGSNRLQDEPLA